MSVNQVIAALAAPRGSDIDNINMIQIIRIESRGRITVQEADYIKQKGKGD